jgi:hypothetical protein
MPIGEMRSRIITTSRLSRQSWWIDVPVRDVLITGGEEVLIDEISEFVPKFRVCTSTLLRLLNHDRLALRRR